MQLLWHREGSAAGGDFAALIILSDNQIFCLRVYEKLKPISCFIAGRV